jgi:predicted HicB family RNase H-like nuclease
MIRKLEIKPNVKPNLEDIIQKGGNVSADKHHKETKVHIFSLRVPDVLNDSLELAVKNRIGLSKNAWVLEAIQEKLKRDIE